MEHGLDQKGKLFFNANLPDSFFSESPALDVLARVRMLHCIVRQHIRAQGEWKSEWGVPVSAFKFEKENVDFDILYSGSSTRLFAHPVYELFCDD